MNAPMLRIVLVTGDIRQGRYVGRDEEAVSISDGVTRRIPYSTIVSIDEVKIPYQACLEIK